MQYIATIFHGYFIVLLKQLLQHDHNLCYTSNEFIQLYLRKSEFVAFKIKIVDYTLGVINGVIEQCLFINIVICFPKMNLWIA